MNEWIKKNSFTNLTPNEVEVKLQELQNDKYVIATRCQEMINTEKYNISTWGYLGANLKVAVLWMANGQKEHKKSIDQIVEEVYGKAVDETVN